MSYRSALSASFSGGSLPKINYLHSHLEDNTSDAGTPIERCRRPTIAWPSTGTSAATPTAAAAAAAVHFQSPDAAVVIAEETDEQQQQLTEPLLLPASPVKEPGVGVQQPGVAVQQSGVTVQQRWGFGLWFELRMVLLLALPTVITSAAQQVIIITSQMFSGHIGTDELAAVALSNTWWNFCWYIILGVSTALDTLGSQAVGAGDKSGLVVWTISSSFVLSIITIPMSVSLWYGGEIATWFFGQGPDVSVLVSKYSRWMIPGLWPMTMAALLQKYLQIQGLVGPPAITSGISIVLNIAANWAGASLLGLPGVAVAATATRLLLLLSMILAVALVEAGGSSSSSGGLTRWWRQPGAWDAVCSTIRAGLSWRITWTFLALGIPGGLMLGLECASFEVTTAFAGYLGPAAVAAHAGVFSLTSLCYIALPFALATAATIRVGNLMGAGKASAAATSSRVVVVLGTSFMAVCGAAIYFTRYQLGQLFTAGDPAVLSAVAAIAPLGAAYQVGDGILGTSQGVLRGLGRQAQLMLLNVACFWCVGVPAGWYLTFKAGWGLEGLWVGMASGCFLAASTSLLLMLLVNWGKEQQAVEAAQEQARAQSRQEGYEEVGEEDEEVAVSLIV